MSYTEEEFYIMVQQLLEKETACFDMLCSIAERTLTGSVYRWCAADRCLRGHEEDILQEIYTRLIITTVPFFLLREEGKVNLDPAGFRSWMFRLAKNLKCDYAARVHSLLNWKENTDLLLPEEDDRRETQECLMAAVNVVLSSDAGVYKTLTWLAQSVFLLHKDMTRIEANRILAEQFAQKDLQALWGLVLSCTRQIPWLRIRKDQQLRIEAALAEPYDATRTWGQVPYQTFFMKKGGRATISDWVNRMDTIIKRVIQNEALNC